LIFFYQQPFAFHVYANMHPVLGFLFMVAVTAYMVRGLQLLLGSSKRAIAERAEEMGHEDDEIPLTETNQSRHNSQSSEANSFATQNTFPPTSESSHNSTSNLIAPERAQDPSRIRGTGGPPVGDFAAQDQLHVEHVQQEPLPLTRPQRWAAFGSANFDRIAYAVLFLFVGLPTYYATGYAMPTQLAFNILAYFVALALPARWRQFLHPVLVSSAITVLAIWILGLVRGDGLHEVLAAYKTNTKYLQLWKGQKDLAAPGAGDIFGSVLDASIVALALPMFQYRKELKQHFFAIVIPNVVISIGSLFGYPALCYTIGISSQRSLAFAARSLTLALATPAVSNIQGDLNTVAALCIMSGILGVLIGPRILQWLRIPEGNNQQMYFSRR
jgi:putative effector of murein hydrolase